MKQNKIPRNEYIRKPVGKTNPYKHDVLYTNLGQWKYPGQITRIPSNDITMQGVPYPVYGEDDLGYGQMMYPGMDYTFPGQYVTEYPQHKVFETEEDFNKDRLLQIRNEYWPTKNTRPFDTGFDVPITRSGPGPVRMPSVTSDYQGIAMMYGGIPMAQKGKQVEDRDSWLENIAEVFDPTGISSWDDVYRAYKNTGLSGETALELLGAIPLLGKIGKSGKIITGGFGLLQDAIKASKYLPASKQQQFINKAFDMYQKYNKAGGKELDEALGSTTKVLRDKIPYVNPSKWKSSDKAINIANKSFKAGRLSDAIQAALGAKDDSGFTWDMRHGDVPKFGGRNIFPQIELGEHGDYAYGGIPMAQKGYNIVPNVEYVKGMGSQYDPILETVYIDSEDPEDPEKLLQHEMWHHYQNYNNYLRLPEGFPTRKRPQTPSTDEVFQEYYNRKKDDVEQISRGFRERYPEFKFVPNHVLYDRAINGIQYDQPWAMEGEGRAAESPEGIEFLRDQGYDIDQYREMLEKAKNKKAYGGIPMAQNGLSKTPEEWEKEIRAVEHKIGDPKKWSQENYQELQDKLNEYKVWRENTPEGRAVIDYHNEPNEYVVFPPAHLNKEKYNMKRALELGYQPDEGGHWPSIDYESGEYLKSKKHPTAWMEYLYGYTLNPEQALNYNVRVNPEGYFGEDQLQYVPKQAYGGDPSLPNITGHYKTGGWLDQYQRRGEVMPSETTQSQVPAYMKSLPKSLKEAQKKETNKKEREDKIIDEIKKTGKIPKNAPENIKLYYTVEPTSYTDYKNIKRLISDESRNVQKSTMYPADEDAWKKYLGLLNESENIKRSKEKPSKAKSEYNQYYKLNDDLEKQYFKDIMQKLEKSKDTNIVTNEFDIQKQTKDTNPYSVLGNFTIGKGKDPLTNKTYVSYYDKYDFNSAPWFMKDKLESVGKPFEFYNRFYPPEYINEIGDTLRFGENDTYMEYFLDDYYNSKLPNKRRGGLYTPPKIKRKAKKYGTSKNIQSSINKLFTRNYDVFGPGGKNIYNPKAYKTGGWLDNVD